MRTTIAQAFILAAGLGTRLRPLTDALPKPLVPIFHKPLLTFALDHLIASGVERFVINTHRLPHLFEEQIPRCEYRGRRVQFAHEPDLLETGGGIKNAELWLGREPFITYSADVLTDVDLQPLIEEHLQRNNDVTLALRDTGLGAEIALRDGRVIDVAQKVKSEGNYDFAGIAVWSDGIFSRIPPMRKTSFFPVLGEWIAQGGKIGGVIVNDGKWFNIGSVAEYVKVHRAIAAEKWKPHHVADATWPAAVSAGAQVDASARVLGCSAVAAGCSVAARARLIDTIVWPGARVATETELRNCVVRAERLAQGKLQDAIV